MCLMSDPKAKPTAYHSPIPVPIHWQDGVKAGLDRDVRLGVLKPVPVSEPITWCNRMVICAKKNKNLEGPLTFNHSIVTTLRKHITLSLPFIKLDRFPIARRKQLLMLGMVTTVSHSTLMIATLLHLLPHWADTDIVLHPSVILLQGMAIQGIMMKLWPHFHGRRSV